jgi:hypothetical protein
MKPRFRALWLALLPAILNSCATPPPPAVFHNSNPAVVVIDSLDGPAGQIVAPSQLAKEAAGSVIDHLKSISRQTTAIIILENYSEPQLGGEFRDRSLPWFMGLRGLGYSHIVFLRGNGSPEPDGLPILAEYD